MQNVVLTEKSVSEQNKRIHPHKFTLWLGLGSIVMMFAGMTSAYIVKRNQANWQGFQLPMIFWYSTATIIASSITMHFSMRAFKERNRRRYRQLLLITAVLGAAFIAMQWIGFNDLNARGIKMIGQGSNVSGSFLFVITALHMAHVLGGIIALAVLLFQAFGRNRRNYSAVPVDNMATYWHFVDALWIYLFIFLSWIQ